MLVEHFIGATAIYSSSERRRGPLVFSAFHARPVWRFLNPSNLLQFDDMFERGIDPGTQTPF